MANSEDTFIPYFKIRWARRSTCTLEQAAYLTCGKNPDLKEFEIAPTATNPVSKRYYWLLNKFKKGSLHALDVVDGADYFNQGSILRALDERKMPIDAEFRKASDHMYSEANGVKNKSVTRSVYREAARLIFEQYPHATKTDVASVLKDLSLYFNTDDHGHIEYLQPHQIEELIKGLNKLTGKPKSDNKVAFVINLKQLVEIL